MLKFEKFHMNNLLFAIAISFSPGDTWEPPKALLSAEVLAVL